MDIYIQIIQKYTNYVQTIRNEEINSAQHHYLKICFFDYLYIEGLKKFVFINPTTVSYHLRM